MPTKVAQEDWGRGGGLIWTHLDSLDLAWTLVISLELTSIVLTWNLLDSLDVSWFNLDSLGFNGSHLISIGLTWSHLDSLRLTWSHLDSFDFTWIHLDSLDLTWIPLINLSQGKGNTWCHKGKEKKSLSGRKEESESNRVTCTSNLTVHTAARTHERNKRISRLLPPPSLRYTYVYINMWIYRQRQLKLDRGFGGSGGFHLNSTGPTGPHEGKGKKSLSRRKEKRERQQSHFRDPLRPYIQLCTHAHTKRNDFPFGPKPPNHDVYIYIYIFRFYQWYEV